MSSLSKDKIPPLKVSDLKKKKGSTDSDSGTRSSESKRKSDQMRNPPKSKSVSPPKAPQSHLCPGSHQSGRNPPKSQIDLMMATMERQTKMFEGLAASLGGLVGQHQQAQQPAQLARKRLAQSCEVNYP